MLLASLLALPDPGPLPKLRALAFDAYQQLWPRPRASQPAVIVANTGPSIAAAVVPPSARTQATAASARTVAALIRVRRAWRYSGTESSGRASSSM